MGQIGPNFETKLLHCGPVPSKTDSLISKCHIALHSQVNSVNTEKVQRVNQDPSQLSQSTGDSPPSTANPQLVGTVRKLEVETCQIPESSIRRSASCILLVTVANAESSTTIGEVSTLVVLHVTRPPNSSRQIEEIATVGNKSFSSSGHSWCRSAAHYRQSGIISVRKSERAR